MAVRIMGWGDTKEDCIEYLERHPELKESGWKVAELGGCWIVGKVEDEG